VPISDDGRDAVRGRRGVGVGDDARVDRDEVPRALLFGGLGHDRLGEGGGEQAATEGVDEVHGGSGWGA